MTNSQNMLKPEQLTTQIALQYSSMSQVMAVALAGSQSNAVADTFSDIDLYVYASTEPDLEQRRFVAEQFSEKMEIDNRFWEPGDEWIDNKTGIHVDVMFRSDEWIEAQLSRVLERHEASVGYSTCFWHNVLYSQILFDRQGWFRALQQKAKTPYPKALQYAIIAKNLPILRNNLSSYTHQIECAIRRNDLFSIHHRITALLASYFDVLFAINRLPHPGEKRLLHIAEARCHLIPDAMTKHVTCLLRSTHDTDVLKHINLLIDGLESLLSKEGLME